MEKITKAQVSPKKYKEILTKEFLKKEYIDNMKSIHKIGKEIGFSGVTIRVYLRKFRIKMRKPGKQKINISKKILINEYLKYQKSSSKIAKLFNCDHTTILSYLKKYNIKIRTIEESIKLLDRTGKNNVRYIDGRKLNKYYCIACGKEITSYSGFYGKGRCSSCATKERFKDPRNHPNYIDGRSYEFYPQEFNSSLKLKIRKRDNFTCQNCGMTEEEHLIVYGRVLDIHHIDYNKKNCDKDNLICLCRGCNIRVNYNREYWKENFKKQIKQEELTCQKD